MTDLPRKAYPLVVPPPGGFEDAVRRGRRRRRQRTGGSTGAALALVGVLAYAITGNQAPTDQLDPAHGPGSRATASVGPIGGEPVVQPSNGPRPTPTAPVTVPSGGRTDAGRQPGSGTGSTLPTSRPTVSVAPPPTKPTLAYAARPRIDREDGVTSTDGECLQAQGRDWCTMARVDHVTNGEFYTLLYYVCRTVSAGDGTLNFRRYPQVDFVAVENATSDAVWRYSAGYPVRNEVDSVDVAAGSCVVWQTNWNGLDDFGRMPAQGDYTLTASSFAQEDVGPASFPFVLE